MDLPEAKAVLSEALSRIDSKGFKAICTCMDKCRYIDFDHALFALSGEIDDTLLALEACGMSLAAVDDVFARVDPRIVVCIAMRLTEISIAISMSPVALGFIAPHLSHDHPLTSALIDGWQARQEWLARPPVWG